MGPLKKILMVMIPLLANIFYMRNHACVVDFMRQLPIYKNDLTKVEMIIQIVSLCATLLTLLILIHLVGTFLLESNTSKNSFNQINKFLKQNILNLSQHLKVFLPAFVYTLLYQSKPEEVDYLYSMGLAWVFCRLLFIALYATGTLTNIPTFRFPSVQLFIGIQFRLILKGLQII